MATTPSTRLMTFEEFQAVPDPPGGRYELHHGELVKVAFPKLPHVEAQHRLLSLLGTAAGQSGVVRIGLRYRPQEEHECWAADVAYISTARWNAQRDYMSGAPDLVVEVLSPSNLAEENAEKKHLCLSSGSCEFWVVDIRRRQVGVYTPDGHGMTYKPGQEIPLFFGGSIPVDAIFA